MYTVTITRKELESHNACADGLALFDAIAPDGTLTIEWSPLCDAWLSVSWHARWLIDCRIVPRANLHRADLRRADLYGAVGITEASS